MKDVVQCFSANELDASLMLPNSPERKSETEPTKRADKGKGKEKEAAFAVLGLGSRHNAEEPVTAARASVKGKERAYTPPESNTSGEVRVRGKERELLAAKQERRERESQRDSDDREKERDKQRICALEEEVHRLKDEVGSSFHVCPLY